MSWIDTHVHFDAPEFNLTRTNDWARARDSGVLAQVVPAVAPFNFNAVREMADAHVGTAYALGIHPMYVNPLDPDVALSALRVALESHIDDPRLVAVGEVGLDGFIKTIDQDKQLYFFQAQLRLAREFDLPVLLHVRHAQDTVIKYLRQFNVHQGIAHAFNGSAAQAQAFIQLGFKLGFGGALTFERALQLRRLAQTLPLASIVLETDAPDIPPKWLYVDAQQRAQGVAQGRNEPGEIPRIGAVLAQLREMPVAALAQATTANACAALPRLAALLV